MIHIAQTSPEMGLYLTSTYLTLNSWRPNRNPEGWRLEDALLHEAGVEVPARSQEKLPEYVKPVPYMRSDIKSLKSLLKPGKPAQVNLQPTTVIEIIYGFRDASKSGFNAGASLSCRGTRWQLGLWCTEMSEQSSNRQEMRTCIDFLKGLISEGLRKAVVVIVTDNKFFYLSYYRFTAKSEAAYQLNLELEQMAVQAGIWIWIIQVAGTRLIKLGIDGLL